MASIDLIKASDGSGNAVTANITAPRSPGATTLTVDSVTGIPSKFIGSMGTPHVFVDPVTSETLTVISEASAVDFAGHVDGSNLEIDTRAPGYTDTGSLVDDIVVIRPTTQWGDNLAAVLAASHDDDGTLKDGAVDSSSVMGTGVVGTTNIANAAVTPGKLANGASLANLDSTATGSGFMEIGRTTLSATGDTLTVSSLPAYQYLRLEFYIIGTGQVNGLLQFNGDSGANYADVESIMFAAPSSIISQTGVYVAGSTTFSPIFGVVDVINPSGHSKLLTAQSLNDGGSAAQTPSTARNVFGKWVNNSQVTSISLTNTGSGDYLADTQLIVLGKN